MPYAKKTDKNTTRKQRDYVKFKDLDRVVEVEDGAMWLENGKYAQPGVSIAIDDEHILSDWTRKIKLQNVSLDVVENDKGYPELVISGVASDRRRRAWRGL